MKMKINSVELTTSAVRQSQYPTDNLPEYLLIGRSNVGKSSFINTILEQKNLARTSSRPGKTQTLNFYLVNEDLAWTDKNSNKKFSKYEGKILVSRKENKDYEYRSQFDRFKALREKENIKK